MFTVTRFCVETFKRRKDGGLACHEVLEFWDEGRAREKAAKARKGSAGVALYSVTGEPVSGLWKRPRLIERCGDVLERD